MRGLKDKVALVVGGAGGNGSAACCRMGEEGCKVVVADFAAEKAEAVAEKIRAKGGTAVSCFVDLGDEKTVEAMTRFAAETYGTIDILLNIAYAPQYMGDDSTTPFTKLDPQLFMDVYKINFVGYMLTIKHTLPYFLKQQRGVIVNTSSTDGTYGNPCRTAYAASKAAIISLASNIAVAYGKMGVRCNTLILGHITHSPSLDQEYPGILGESIKHNILTPTLAGEQDVAAAFAFLASDDAAHITADVLKVDDGLKGHTPLLPAINTNPEKNWAYPKCLMPENYPNGWTEA